jgi:ATP-binding cassette subfamily C protein
MFMLEIYDRVLPSRSVQTLVGVGVLTLILFLAMGALDAIRNRILVRIGAAFDQALSDRVFRLSLRLPLAVGAKSVTQAPLRDVEAIRAFLASPGPSALFDLPWIPLYMMVIVAFHPLLGWTALAGAVTLTALAALTEIATRGAARRAHETAATRGVIADSGRHNAEVAAAMGMRGPLSQIWGASNRAQSGWSARQSDIAGGLGAISRTLRFMLQWAILGIGAWLAIRNEATPGVIIAASILFGRALAPVDSVIAHAKGMVTARQAWERLRRLLATLGPEDAKMTLPRRRSRCRWRTFRSSRLAAARRWRATSPSDCRPGMRSASSIRRAPANRVSFARSSAPGRRRAAR